MEKVKLKLYQLTLLLTLVSIALALISSGKQRELFYIAVYASIVGLLLERKNLRLTNFSIAFPILAIGLLNLAWYMIYEFHREGINVYSDYFGSSKKLILGSLLIFYIDRFKFYIAAERFKAILMYVTGIGLILATLYALYQAYHGMARVEMGINRATVSAYVYASLSLAFIYSLFVTGKRWAYVAASGFILISFIIILLTGTRAVMGLYFVLLLLLTLYHFRKIHIKSALGLTCVVIGICALSYTSYIKPKIDQTYVEINDFQKGNDATSLGARFSMWKVGLANGLAHPVGQSLEDRVQWTKSYVKNNPHLASSLTYINVHLHNEFIEKYSLQGIPGVVVLLFFFIALLTSALKKDNALLLITTVMLLLFGLTDVILLSSEAVIFYITLFALSTLCNRPKKYLNKQ